MDKLVIFSAYGDGSIESRSAPSLKAAQQDMFRAYVRFVTGVPFEEGKYRDKSFPECLNEIMKDEDLYNEDGGVGSDTMWISETSAYFYSDRCCKEYAWSIEEFPVPYAPAERVQTKLGTLLVDAFESNDYPGVQVSLQRTADEPSTMLAWVEVDQSADETVTDPTLKIHTYSVDPEKDEPIFNYEAKEKNGQLADAETEMIVYSKREKEE